MRAHKCGSRSHLPVALFVKDLYKEWGVGPEQEGQQYTPSWRVR